MNQEATHPSQKTLPQQHNAAALGLVYGYSYFGARYYDSEVSVWLSVDPLADKYPSMSPYMYTAGNPVMLVDPDGMRLRATNPEAVSLIFALLDSYGRDLFNITEQPLKKHRFDIDKKLKLRNFKKKLIENGFEKDSEDYNGAIALFKVLKSKKTYDVTVLSTSSTVEPLETFSSLVFNNTVEDFKKNYHNRKTPSQNEIGDFLKKGKMNGNDWALFDDERNNSKQKKKQGRVFINQSNSDYAQVYSNSTDTKVDVNTFKNAINEISKEVNDVK